jgi:hypothetical protein
MQLPNNNTETLAWQCLNFSEWGASATENDDTSIFDYCHKIKSQICQNPVNSKGFRRAEKIWRQKIERINL